MAARHPSWQVGNGSASRTFTFADFAAAMGFVTRIGLVAEKADHHPDIDIRWNKVALTFSTHSIGGKLSDQDEALVAVIDSWGAP
ncbi:MAG TPA: 4a-hydroxytetrahydrobiopterin dehydratase [Acidimicrobiia bacterium]|nr:4a-hydroxytetrahydrobiopterin dehydratase [Acidimicrobiia bacterium]